jgi:hypothetical protein
MQDGRASRHAPGDYLAYLVRFTPVIVVVVMVPATAPPMQGCRLEFRP